MTFFKFCKGCESRIEQAGRSQKYCNKCKIKIKKIATKKTKEHYKRKNGNN